MKLRKNKNAGNNIISNIHNKTVLYPRNQNTSIEGNSESSRNESVYLNKILNKNMGAKKKTEIANFKENIPNFHSSIQNIFSNEESRQKAMRYVINMRNKRIQLSPFAIRTINSRNKNARNISNNNNDLSNNGKLYKSVNEGFYEPIVKTKNIFKNLNIQDINILEKDNIYKSSCYGRELKNDLSTKKNIAKQNYQAGYNTFSNRFQPNNKDKGDKAIRVNKLNKYYNDVPNKSRDENLFIRNKLNSERNNSKEFKIILNTDYNNIEFDDNNRIYPKTKGKYFYTKDNKNAQYGNYYNNNRFMKPMNIKHSFDEEDNQDYKYINNKYNQNDFYEDLNAEMNQFQNNSLSENDNSGLREILPDKLNINQNYQSPNHENDKEFNYYKKPLNNMNNYKSKVYNKYRNRNNKINLDISNEKSKEKEKHNNSFIKSKYIPNYNNLKIEKNRFSIKGNPKKNISNSNIYYKRNKNKKKR